MASAIPSSVYVLRKNQRIVAYLDNGTSYLIGFVQSTHAHLVRMHITNSSMVRLERKDVMASLEPIDGNEVVATNPQALLSIVRAENQPDDYVADNGYEVAPIEYSKFVTLPMRTNMGVLVPYAFMSDEDDGASFNFRCHVMDPPLP